MDAARWRRVEELFAAAVERPPGERRSFLELACGGDPGLLAEVESLLRSDRADEFLEKPASAEAARAVAAASRESLVGRRLGPYQIVAPLGAGGMGEVYRARDTRLDRSVAIKVMPPHLAGDADARHRFDREARAISALAHPHICALHDVGSQDGVDFLVMELVEGETLAARLERGPVPFADALRWAGEIADALARAHRAGIVHRDLKPGNVMLTKTGVKLLDFGLARRSAPVTAGELTRGLGRTEPLTAEGTILGTLHYMAPEQLEGKPVDQRADLFALGALLYELVTGARAFTGATPASVISAILRDSPPPPSTRAPLAPPALDELVRHCLAKDPEERWQSAHDLHLQLRSLGAREAERGKAASPRQRWLPWAVAAALAATLALVVGWLALQRPRQETGPVVRFELPHPAGGRYWHSVESSTMALSPDGTLFGFITVAAKGPSSTIWVRPLGELAAREVPGTEGARSLFWSPDGQELGFVANGKLKRVRLDGGTPLVLCDVEEGLGVSGSWGREWILFDAVDRKSLRRVPVGGGTPDDALTVDAGRGERRVRWPWFLPDGERFLYVVNRGDKPSELRLAGPGDEPRTIARIGSRVEVVDPGFLVFARDGALVAQRFDADRAALVGPPIPLAPAVRGFASTGAASFATSRQGTVVVAPQDDLHRVTLFAPDGRLLGPVGELATAGSLALSPDGRRVIVDRLRPGLLTWDLWLVDLERGVETRITDAPDTEVFALWLPRPAGTIVYSLRREGPPNLVRRDLASGREQRLMDPGPFQIAAAATPEGDRLLFRQRSAAGTFALLSAPLDGRTPPTAVLPPELAVWSAELSPDGRLLAYSSPEGGRPELFVRPLDGSGESVRVSREGAWVARFSADGRTLFYTTGDRQVAAVAISGGQSGVGVPENRFSTTGLGWVDFDVLPDGRFVALVREVDGSQAPLTVITGWNERPQ